MGKFDNETDLIINKHGNTGKYELKLLSIADIVVDKRIRQDIKDELGELSRSVADNGILYPILVAPYKDGKYLLVDGYRRLISAGINEMKEIPCIINQNIDTDKVIILESVTNTHQKYKMKERLDYVTNLENEGVVNGEIIEGLAGLEQGDYEKLRVIRDAEDVTILDKIENEKTTITKAYRKLMKEMEAANEENYDDLPAPEMPEEEAVEEENIELAQPQKECRNEDVIRHVLEKDNFTCQCCGVHGDEYKKVLDCHLVTPEYLGGEETEENGVCVCIRCHKQIHLRATDRLVIPDKKSEEELANMSEMEQIEYGREQKTFKNILKYGDKIRKGIKEQGLDVGNIIAQDELIGFGTPNLDAQPENNEDEIEETNEEIDENKKNIEEAIGDEVVEDEESIEKKEEDNEETNEEENEDNEENSDEE